MEVIVVAYIYRGTVCSDLNTIKSFIEKTLYNLSEIIEDRDTMFDIKLILNELIVNGALHGNHRQASKCVNLKLEMIGNKLTIEVEDEGLGIDFNLASYDPTELKCWGRGLILVHGLSDEFHVEKNRVVSVKHIN